MTMNKEPICVVKVGNGEGATFYFNDIPTYEQVRDAYRERFSDDVDDAAFGGAFDSKDKVPTGGSRERGVKLHVYSVVLYIIQPMWVDQAPKEEKLPKPDRIKNKYTLQEHILDVLACSDVPMSIIQLGRGVVAKGYKSTAMKFANVLRHQTYRLSDNEEVEVLEDGTFTITEKGRERWIILTAGEFNNKYHSGNHSWANPTTFAIARGYKEEPAADKLLVLADALEEIGADKEVLAWCRHKHYGPVFAQWLPQWDK